MNLPSLARRLGLFYGWIIVFICFVVICLVFGVRLSFGVFFEALTRSGEFNWTRADAAGVFSLSVLVQTFVSAGVGWLVDRLGTRRVYTVGLLVVAAGLALTSRIGNLRDFYLAFGIVVGLGTAILGLAIHGTAISRWFDRAGRRGLAIGLAYAGTGVGILFLAPLLERIIARFDWRSAYLFLAVLALVVVLPLVLLLLRDSPAQLGLRPDGQDLHDVTAADERRNTPASPRRVAQWTTRQALRDPSFWLIMIAGTGSLFTLRMVTVHQVAYFVDQGFSRLTAATVFGSSGLITGLSYIGFGTLSDRIGRERAFYLGAAAQVVALLLLIVLWPGAPSLFLYTYALLWGIGEGSRSGLLTTIASDRFPGPDLGTIIGVLGAFFGLGAALGSWFGGLIYDWSGSYRLAFELALAATFLSAGAIALMRPCTERWSWPHIPQQKS